MTRNLILSGLVLKSRPSLKVGLVICLFGAGVWTAPPVFASQAKRTAVKMAPSKPRLSRARLAVLERKLRAEYGFDDLNWSYFRALYQKKKAEAKEGSKSLRIYDPGAAAETGPGALVAYPTAIADAKLMTQLPFVDYAGLLLPDKSYVATARTAELWMKKMQAGTGSSMTRTSYLARILGIAPEAVKIGAKGTDLFIELPGGGRISLVEAQLLQAIHDAKAGLFARIDLHDILSTETRDSLEAVWKKKSLIDPSKTYEELVNGMSSLSRSGHTQQAYMPTLDRSGKVTFGRTAPGGHALFAVDALRAAIIDSLRPNSEGRPLISVIGNGEDLSSTPDPAIIGWMIESKAPIVMVTTEKTPNDMKGGQIALAVRDIGTKLDPQTETFATIIEAAQAESAGQLELFQKLGLRPGDKMAFFNTNMALFNYDVLGPKLKQLHADVGEEEFMRIVSPDLIKNQKGEFTQLEGAMGSSLLNLDRYWRKQYGEPLVHIVNVGKEHRTKYYSPIKSAFDYFMQFHSDRFSFDLTTMRLMNKRPGVLPSVGLADKYYADVENVLNAFGGASLLDLESLKIDGKVSLKGVALKGNVRIASLSPTLFDLAAYLKSKGKKGSLVLENVSIEISAAGAVTISR